ncbi:hypothetical protein [Laceyella putida]|uniref:Uncharacterized protein n=2 Tax=Laceyella putida TaxID=110101 RepID=A0ABW2RPA0_9BACL
MQQRGLSILCGAACFCLGLAKLPLHFQSGIVSLFVALWLVMMGFFLIANLNDLIRQIRLEQRRKEAERRRQWLEAERQWKRQRRLAVYQR